MAVSVLGFGWPGAANFRSRLTPFRPDSARGERAQRELGPDRAPLLRARALRSPYYGSLHPGYKSALRAHLPLGGRRAFAMIQGNRACRRMRRENSSAMKSVVIRNGIL